MQKIEQMIRFSSDVDEYHALLADEVIGNLAQKRLKSIREDGYRRDLLGNSLRITPSIAPDLYSIVQDAQSKLGLEEKKIEIYIYSSPEPNASCAYLGGERVILTFSSGLLKTMNRDELKFVAGHELGHSLFKHSALPFHGILESGELSAESAMRLMAWSRRAEVSADRAGLYVCQDPEAAISSFLKLSCGVSYPIISFDLREYSKQIQDLEEMADNLADTSHCYSSHPFNPIRVVAVELYSRSRDFHRLTGQGSGMLTIDQVDEEINKVLSFMEPVPKDKEKEIIDECVFWAGAWIAHADGEFVEVEAENLKQQIDSAVFARHIGLLEQVDDPGALARERFFNSVKPLKTLPAPDRCSIVQRLVVVARADQRMDDKEFDVLNTVCDELAVERSFVQQILMFLN
ncbi:M48 family metalloprotease [Exilibacterium tricleocarpae]|uniref:M48 family metalloprotease n=1 Tax=Exilibacterium tricleocarpae TaxID=2591008 RepID=A0A545SYY5_9GAMM|nr:M48 family metallopeptidase [Exilibacterium tricleocarpae]TQV70178.1 M48 family metalloprotease [Exilibacterium tricleocarpae]